MKFEYKAYLHPQYVAFGVLILFIAGIGYELYMLNTKTSKMSQEIDQLKTDQTATAKNLSDTIAILNQNLSLTKEEQDKLRDVLSFEQQRLEAQGQRINSISGTVGTLEKLTYTDEELLKKYSKIYFLNEHYVPAKLSRIDPRYTYQGRDDIQIHTSVLPFLEALLKANPDPDFDLRVISSYRSFGTQSSLKSNYTVTYGAGTANQFSADQGYSEHQLGTTVDFTTVRTGGDFGSFDGTSDYKWLLENAHKYGFTLSYPESNSYYQFEPWHWRFVGVKLATKLYNEGKHFYDLEQREIDAYLVSIFDK